MPQAVKLLQLASPSDKDYQAIRSVLDNFNREFIALNAAEAVAWVLYSEEKLVGGLWGQLLWQHWLYVDVLALDAAYRAQGWGAQLLTAAEAYAVSKGCKAAYLDTISFQAPHFYSKQGYTVFGTQANFPPGFTRYFLQKNL